MSTRPTFIKPAAGCCLASAVAPHLPFNSLNVGVGTYNYHGLSIDEMIAQLTALSVRELEMSRVRFTDGGN
jgi:inosose dehydratase